MCFESVHLLMESPSSFFLIFAIIKECKGPISLGNSGILPRHGLFLFALARAPAIPQRIWAALPTEMAISSFPLDSFAYSLQSQAAQRSTTEKII